MVLQDTELEDQIEAVSKNAFNLIPIFPAFWYFLIQGYKC